MIIGIPRSFFYYEYETLIKTFFNELDIDYIISEESNQNTLKNGEKYLPKDTCIPLKLFLGHIEYLKNKCNMILVPRIIKNNICPIFKGLYDLTNNLFKENILDLNLNIDKYKDLKLGLVELGLSLGLPYNKTVTAYKRAIEKQNKVKNNLILKQSNILKNNKRKILIKGTNYNIFDNMIGKQIIDILKEQNIEIIYENYNKEENYKEYLNKAIRISSNNCPRIIMNNLNNNIKTINIIINENTTKKELKTIIERFLKNE